MSEGIRQRGYEPLLLLSDGAHGAAASLPEAPAEVHFARLPRLRRTYSPWNAVRYLLDSIGATAQTVRVVREREPSLVHVNEIFDLYAGIAARLCGVPCVWHVRADLSSAPALRFVLPKIVRQLASAIVVVSDSVAEHVFGPQRGRGPELHVIRDPGPDPALFNPGIDARSARKELAANDCPLVVLVAKLTRPKGHEVLIRAAPHVLSRFPRARFALVGGEVEGRHHREYLAHLRTLCQELGVERAVAFLGYRHDIPQIMAAADVVVHCSIFPDPFPGVVLQAMALGKALIASDIGGPREQVVAGVSGLLVRPGEPSALASAICMLLADPQMRARLGAAAVERAREFSADSYFGRLCEVYDDLQWHGNGRG